jgi:two-component system sensor histidine kinase YesM
MQNEPKFKSISLFLENMSLRPRLIITYLASILVPLLIFGCVLYFVSMIEIETEMRKVSLQSVKQVNTTLNEYINQIDTLSLMPYTDKDIEEYMLNTSGQNAYQAIIRPNAGGPVFQSGTEAKPDAEKMQAFLQNLMGVKQDIDFMSMISLDGGIVTKSKFGIVKIQYDFFHDDLYEKLRQSTGEKVMIPIHKADYLFAPSKNVFSLGRRIFNFSRGVYTGFMLIDCDTKVFERICREVNIGKSGYVFIADSSGNVLYRSGGSGGIDIRKVMDRIGEQKSVNAIEDFGAHKTILVSDTSDYTGWTAIGILPYEEVLQRVAGIKTIFFTLSVLFILLVFAISVLISRSVTRPMRNLQNAMRAFEKGNTDIRVSIRSYNEIGELSHSFNQLMQKINTLLASIKSIEIKKREAELESLKSQINPHFLYNTLESIRMMAVIDENRDIASATEALANLFRYSVRQRKDIVEVRYEIQHAKNYILLQKIRYGDKFDVIYDIDEDILDCKTLKFTLQPIVENAIYHGLEKKKGKGLLIVRAKRVENDLEFEVRDNGAGMQLLQLSRLREHISSCSDDGTQSIGLKNVNERIVLYFGGNYGLTIDSMPGEGTVVKLAIPAFNDEEWVMENVKGISGR